MGTRKSEFVKSVCDMVTRRMKESLRFPGYYSCDLLAMAAAVNPSCVAVSKFHPACLELRGTTTRGSLIVDKRTGIKGNKPSLEFILQFHLEILKDMYTQMLQ